LSTRHVRKWIAAPIIGFLAVGCGSSNTTFTGVGGSGNGGTSTGGSGVDQGGNGGSSAGTTSGGAGGSGGSTAGTGGSGGSTAGTGGSGATGSGATGGSGGSAPDIDYDPVGIGDPWFFGAEEDMSLFTFAAAGGATENHFWSNGEIHITATIPDEGDGRDVQMQFTTPYDGTINTADLTGRVIKARVRVAAGATAGGGVQVFTQSGGWSTPGNWVTAGWTNIEDLGSYTDITFPITSALEPTNVQRFGLQLFGGSGGTVELIVDDLRLEPADPEPDGGAPEADAGGGDQPLVDAGGGYEPPPVDAGGGDDPPPVDAGGGGSGGEQPDAGGGGTGGSGGLGYEPAGVGDPWFFDTEAEMNEFSFAGNGTQTHSWSAGEVHIMATIPAAANDVQMHVTMPDNLADLTGRVLKARVKVAAGATATGAVQFFVQSDGWGAWNTAGWTGFEGLGSYTDITFPMTSAGNAASVQRLGLQIYGSTAGEVELIIDDLRIEPATP
jgi:hypothetical protein